eukprot:5382505-Prymnesium_polylepis.1
MRVCQRVARAVAEGREQRDWRVRGRPGPPHLQRFLRALVDVRRRDLHYAPRDPAGDPVRKASLGRGLDVLGGKVEPEAVEDGP